MKRLTCIIAAYNEAERIGNVLSVLEQCPFVDEIIVVDDGSHDRTAEVVLKYARVRLISYQPNKGKSHAIAEGLKAATGDLVMFLDADLAGLTPDDVQTLVEPVRSGKADMSMSLRANSLLIYRILGLDFVSGERILPRALLMEHLEEITRLPGFGLETFLNRITIREHLSIRIVFWNHVTNTRKSAKIGFWHGAIAELAMIRQVLKVASVAEIIRQNYWLLRLRSRA